MIVFGSGVARLSNPVEFLPPNRSDTEIARCRGYDGALIRLIELRYPIIGIAIAAKDVAEKEPVTFCQIVWVNEFPDDFAVRRNLKHAPAIAFRD